jgi:hypothetical protein
MPLDPVIAGGFRGLQLQDPLEQYGRISQIQQAQQQNQLAALKMQEYQRGAETQNRLRSLDPSAANYMMEVMRLDPGLGSQLQLRAKQQTAAERAAAASDAEARAKNMSYWQGLARDSSRTPTDDVVAGLARRAVELGVTDEDTASSQLQQLLAMPPEQRTQVLAQYGAPAAAPPAAPATPADVATMQALGFPLTQQGYEQFRAAQRQPPTYTPSPDMQGYELAKSEGYKGTFFDYQRQLAEAKRPPAQPKEPNKPVEVVGLDGKPIIVSAEEAIAGRMTPAKAMEGLPPKEIQRREADYPKATASFKNFIAKSEQYIKELEKLRDDPGLDSITGTIYGVTPGVISGAAGRRAKAQYDKVFAKGGFQALQDLKAMSPSGGALGNVSNEEGRRLESSTVGGLDRSQQLADVQQGINDYIAEIRGSMKRVGDAYGDTYEYRTTRGGAPAAPPGLSPEDKQALDWANSNPKSPYAAEIKKRLGM